MNEFKAIINQIEYAGNEYFWCYDCRPNGQIGKLIPFEKEAIWHKQELQHQVKFMHPIYEEYSQAV